MSQEQSTEDLPVRVAEYIDFVVRKMRYRRRVRQEVRRELAAHFSDALAECTDENERRELGDKLIEEFGNGRMLAALIRRGKKRCRPLWKKAIIRSSQAVGVLILVFIAYTAWFMTGKPTIRVDYVAQWNEMARPKAAEDDNAWPHYERAISLYIEPSDIIAEYVPDGYCGDIELSAPSEAGVSKLDNPAWPKASHRARTELCV